MNTFFDLSPKEIEGLNAELRQEYLDEYYQQQEEWYQIPSPIKKYFHSTSLSTGIYSIKNPHLFLVSNPIKFIL